MARLDGWRCWRRAVAGRGGLCGSETGAFGVFVWLPPERAGQRGPRRRPACLLACPRHNTSASRNGPDAFGSLGVCAAAAPPVLCCVRARRTAPILSTARRVGVREAPEQITKIVNVYRQGPGVFPVAFQGEALPDKPQLPGQAIDEPEMFAFRRCAMFQTS